MAAPTISLPTTGTDPKVAAKGELESTVNAALEVNYDNIEAHKAATDNPHAVTKAQVGLGSADDTSDADKPVSSATQTQLNLKASVSALSAHTGNTANPHSVTKAQVGLGNVDNTSDANKPISDATATALAGKATTAQGVKADSALQVGASIDDIAESATHKKLTAAERTKLAGVETGATADQTGAEIKAAYEGEANTNAYTDAEKTKLAGVATAATANSTDAALRARASHTGTQTLDTITETADKKVMTAAERTKLAGVATAATANDTDANLRARGNHTGTQAISTVTGLQTALDGKATTAQGAKADTAVQPGALGTAAAQDVGAFATAAQGVKADTAVQPAVTNALAVEIENLTVNESTRPGDDPQQFSSETTGDPAVRAVLAIGAAAVTDAAGKVWAVDEAGIVAPRRAYAMEADRVYQLRVVIQRTTDSADPSGDAVEVGFQNLSKSKAHVSRISLQTWDNPEVADGLLEYVGTVSRAAGADYQTPATARYAVPFVLTFGDSAVTAVVSFHWLDITDFSVVADEVQANVDAEATARADADTALGVLITNEATARNNADTTLQENITAEATARGNADTALQTNITAEATARSNADDAIIADLDAVEATIDVDTARTGYAWGVIDAVKRVAFGVTNSGKLALKGRAIADVDAARTGYSWGVIDRARRVALALKPDGSLWFKGANVSDILTPEAIRRNQRTEIIDGRTGYAWAVIDAARRVAFGVSQAGALILKGKKVMEVNGGRTGYAWAVVDPSGRVPLGLRPDGRLFYRGADISDVLTPDDDARFVSSDDVVCWGDSLTEGAGSTGGSTYPVQLAALTGRTVMGLGRGSQTAQMIAARAGGRASLLTVSGNEIPASGPVTVTDLSIALMFYAGGAWNLPGTLAGVPGQLNEDGDGGYTFTRTASGSAVPCYPDTPFIPTTVHPGRTHIIWLGRNNYSNVTDAGILAAANETIKDCIASIVGEMNTLEKRFIILGVTSRDDVIEYTGTANFNAKRDLAEDLARQYPKSFIDIDVILRGNGDGGATDNADIANGVLPSSLTAADRIHLNNDGYAIVAAEIAARFDQNGW